MTPPPLHAITTPADPGSTLAPILIGFAIGTLFAAAVAWAMVRRYVARVRAADARARRAERLAELGAMTSGLAHEIKNPLSTIGLNVQLLSEGLEDLGLEPDDRDPLLRRLGSLGREAERLRGILTDFLEYAGELRIEPRTADLNSTVDELIDFFLPQAESQGVRVRSDLAPGRVEGYFDPPQLKQAVLNLMLNAVQAMAKHKPDVPRELILRTLRQLDEERRPVAVLHITDTGPGIDEQTAARIFDPYFTTKSGGSGLGLPTARRIVEAHHGRLDLHSEPGRGTDFTITLPGDPPGAQQNGPARQ